MLKKVFFTVFGSFALLFSLLSGEQLEGAIGNASATILFGTNPADHFSSVKVYHYDDGYVSIDVKLPGSTRHYVLSRPLGFMPGWLAQKAQDSNDVTVTSPDGLKYIYPEDCDHMLKWIKNADDVNIVTFEYDSGRIDKQEDACDPNLYIEYEYDSNDLLAKLTACDYSDCREYEIAYANNRVIAISGSCESCGGGGGFQYEYGADGLLKKVRDVNDPNVVIYEYEYENGLLTDAYLGEANDSNHIQEFDYTSTGSGNYTVDILDYVGANNYRVTREYRNSAGIVTRRIRYEEPNEDPADPNGKSFVEHTVYFYDASNNVTKKVVIPPLGDSNDPPNPDSGIRKEYIYDTNTGKVQTEKWFDADDANFTVGEYTYECVPDPCGNTLSVRVKTYKDARGATTEYFYDGNDVDPNLKIMPEVTEGISGTQQLKYYYEYDNRNRITLEKQLDDSNTLAQTQYEYDDYGNLLKRYDYHEESDSNEITEYKYNGFNQMVRMKLSSGVVSGRRYNSNGKLESEFVMTDVNDFNEPDDQELQLFSQTKYVYDGYGRVIQIAKADDANESGFEFNNPTAWIYTEYEYDLRGNRTKVIEDVNGLELETTYKYNNQGEVVQVTLPNGKWTKTYRDGRGLVIKTEVGYDSETVATTEFQYDGNGNMTRQKGADGYWTRYEYDDFDRLIKVTKGL